MRILLVNHQLNTGGTEKLFVMMANLLHHKGHQVKVIIINEPAALDFELATAIPIVYLRRKNKFSLFTMRQLANECKVADIIHLHSYYNWRYLYICSIFFRMGKGRMILQEHSSLKNLKWIDKFVLPEIDAFIAVHPLQEYKAHEGGVAAHKLFLLPNIVSSVVKLQVEKQRTNRIIMVGDFKREKYYQLAFDILKKLPAHLSLDIYGRIKDTVYHKELLLLIKEFSLAERVNIIDAESNVVNHFHQYDLAIHTANNETGPLVVLEYLAAGLPFLISSAGQSAALISRHNANWVISSYNSNVWIEAINSFYQLNEDERMDWHKQLKDVAEKLLNPDQYYLSLLNIYEQSTRV